MESHFRSASTLHLIFRVLVLLLILPLSLTGSTCVCRFYVKNSMASAKSCKFFYGEDEIV